MGAGLQIFEMIPGVRFLTGFHTSRDLVSHPFVNNTWFNLWKWASNSEELMDLIRKEREQRDLQAEPAVIDKPDSVSDNMINDPENCKTVTQDSVTFAKVSVGPDLQEIDSLNQVKILGNRWNF